MKLGMFKFAGELKLVLKSATHEIDLFILRLKYVSLESTIEIYLRVVAYVFHQKGIR